MYGEEYEYETTNVEFQIHTHSYKSKLILKIHHSIYSWNLIHGSPFFFFFFKEKEKNNNTHLLMFH